MSDGRVAVVTGASSGLGAEIASILAARGCGRLVLLNRSRAGSEAVLARLRAERPEVRVEVVEADLADQDQVRAAAERIAAGCPRLDALFNNAGVLLGELRFSKHGNEMHFQVNTLAPYMLMRLLRRPLATAGTSGRVLNVSSGSVWMTGRLKVDELRRPPKLTRLTGPYAQSKLALTTLTNALAPEYAASGGTVLRSADPGGNATKMTRGGGMPGLLRWMGPFFKSPAKGAALLVDAALDPTLGDEGGLFVAGGKAKKPPRDADDPPVRAALLRLCGELTGV